MHALKRFLLLTTALTMVIPCEANAATLSFDTKQDINKIEEQPVGGGVKISQGADLTFSNGGMIWDYSGYHQGGVNIGSGSIEITGIGTKDVSGGEISGNFIVSNGIFTGAVKMYKGHDTDEVSIGTSKYTVVSAGYFRISEGTFNFSDGSELLMKRTATGNFYVESGTFNSSGTSTIKIGSEYGLNDVFISGGTFNIDGESIISVIGKEISVTGLTKATGSGTLSFSGATTISKDIAWETGTLQFGSGTMSIDSNITVNKFEFTNQSDTLKIEKDKVLTVRTNFEMKGASSLQGEEGTLKLVNGASATFQKLDDFGTIIAEGAGKGVLSFKDSSTVSTISIDNGTLNVDSLLTVTDLTLKNNAKANINGELRVTGLNFDAGSINFATNAKQITFQGSSKTTSSTIKNTAKFTFADGVKGKLVLENTDESDGIELNFDDSENDTTTRFSYDKLSIQAKEGTTVNFNQTQGVDLDDVSALQAIVNIKKGNSHFNSMELGDANSAKGGALNIGSGAALTADEFKSYIGTINVAENGLLTLKSGNIYGDESAASTFTGTGTLKVTGELAFNGRFKNFGTLQLDGGAVFNFGGLSNNAVGTVSFTGTTDAVMNITSGIFKANSLNFADGSKGSINIVKGGTLALDANGADVSSIIHGTGSIGGEGTLRLENNTSVSFGGNDKIKDLGTLEIGNGTATISGAITIGNVKFYQETGTLSIADGKTLSLKTITTNKSNKVTGAGTLQLTGTGKSTFGGPVSGLGTLNFATGDVEFSNTGVSTVGTITGNGGNLTVNNGTLSVKTAFFMTGGKVSGTGTLQLTNGGTFTTGGDTLNKLIVGGTTTLSGASAVNALEFSTAATVNISNSLSAGTVSTVDGAVLSGGTLTLTGTGTFAANSVKTSDLSVSNGAKAVFAGDNSLTKLSMNGTASVVINRGATLTLAQDSVGAADSVITGAGTLALNKSGLTMNALLSNLGILTVSKSATLNNTAQIGTLQIEDGASLNVNNTAQVGTLQIEDRAAMVQDADVTAGTVSFDSNGKLTVNGGKTLNVTQSITAGAGTLNGTGTVNLSGGASGLFATGTSSFAGGNLRIGSGTARFTGDTSMASVAFSGSNGTLSIDAGTLTLAKITTKASNVLTGKGTLTLTGAGSTFDAPIASLGKLNIANGGASFSKSATIDEVAFDNGGSLTVGSGAVLTAAKLTQSGTLGTVSGAGAFRIGAGTADFSTGGNSIGGLYIGSGSLNIKGDSKAGKVVFESDNGKLNVVDKSTLTVSDALIASGTVGGNGTLVLENGGQFKQALNFGTITTGSGALTFYEDSTVNTVNVGNGSAYFRKSATVSNLNLAAGDVFFNSSATINKLAMSGAGKVTFSKDASITNDASIGGTLDIGTTHLNVGNGLTFADNSSLHLRLMAKATDDMGKIVDHTAYGKINVGSGTIEIGNNVNLDLTIDYGLHTAADGTEFNLISGTLNSGAFTFANSRYKLEAVTCSSGSGLCYKLKETSNAEEIVEEEKGSQNNQNTAAAVLDGGLFNETDKMFAVASHLDALSQKKGGGRAYLNALTALAPDVSGAVTGQSVLTQTRVSKSVFNRLSGLQKKMGNRSEKYRQMRELYGRSGGSAYNSGLMRSTEYYKKAGYYDAPAKRAYPSYEAQGRITPRDYDYEPRSGKTYPAYEPKGRMPSDRGAYDDFDKQPKRKIAKYRSQRQADYGAFYGARPAVGVWAQGLYNTNEYKSASKEDGFSADSTGVSMGLDVIFADVAAIGFGYARTTSDLSALQRSTDVTGDTFFLYGMYKPANWYLSGVVSSGKNTFEEQKDLSGMTVSDNYDTKTIGGQLMLGFDTKSWNPAFGLRYASVSRAAHEDSVGQKIASFSNTVFSAVAETQKTFELSRAGKGVWSSDVSAGLVYDFSRSEDEATVSLTNGASYTVKGADIDPYGAELGAGISYVWGSSVDLSARYNLDVRPEWFSHTLSATLRVTF